MAWLINQLFECSQPACFSAHPRSRTGLLSSVANQPKKRRAALAALLLNTPSQRKATRLA